MNNSVFLFALAAGVFVGNFAIHAFQGNPGKGAAIGAIAAVLVFLFYGIFRLLT